MRWLLRLGVFALVVVGGAVAIGELLVEPAVERRVASEVQERYGLATTPSVDIESFPFLLDAASGRLDGATVDAGGLVVEGLSIDAARFDLDGIRFSALDMVLDRQEASADFVEGRVEVGDAALNAYLQSRNLPVVVALTPQGIVVRGTVTVAGREVSAEGTGTVTVENSVLRFAPVDVRVEGFGLGDAVSSAVREQLTFEVAVPQVVGVTVTGLAVGDGRATLTAAAQNYDLLGTTV